MKAVEYETEYMNENKLGVDLLIQKYNKHIIKKHLITKVQFIYSIRSTVFNRTYSSSSYSSS